ncbi:MAG TPA: response regulator [Vicinamibacterales bacterium]
MSNGAEPSATRRSGEDVPPLRVLLVEDHPDVAAAMGEFLRSEGLEVQTAVSGRDALDVAQAFKPQLILCDLYLPDMNGLEVARDLRSNSATARSCIAILSAASGVEVERQREANQQSVDAVISKPIGLEALHRLVEATRRRISPERNNP